MKTNLKEKNIYRKGTYTCSQIFLVQSIYLSFLFIERQCSFRIGLGLFSMSIRVIALNISRFDVIRDFIGTGFNMMEKHMIV